MIIRISYGTAVKMGLKKGKMLADPTTAYIMVGEKCISNCSFCAQRRDARRDGYLSRILWLPYPKEVLRKIRGFSRICFQTLDYPGVVDDLIEILPILPAIPVSVSIVPIPRDEMLLLRDAGVEILSIALDAANPEVFNIVKGSGVGNRFTWKGHWNALKMATEIFSGVNTHLIVGLGENDDDLIKIMKELAGMGITTALFSFTPVNGGVSPPLGRYRAVQLARYLIYKGHSDDIEVEGGRIVRIGVPQDEKRNVLRGIPFLTSGCPGCNRPFYNERPWGTIYNYPSLPVDGKERVKELEEYAKLIWI